MNPGQSVKDRAALFIIRDAIERGTLRKGGVIVEGTAGNTGIGLALVADAMGFRTVIVIPETQSQEKKDTLRIAGAELIEVPAVPYRDPNNYVKVSGRLAEQLAKSDPNGAIWANQFDNTANRRAHYEGTGPEIWQQTDGKVDGFVAAVGTGGTLAGVGMALKERNPHVQIALADPMGAALYSWYTTGVLKSEGSSITEGIGQGRITGNLEGAPVDRAYQIKDDEAVRIVFDLIGEEGLVLGGSSGINVAGAIRLARELGPGPHHRHRALRLRHALPVEAVQPGIPARARSSGAGMARAQIDHQGAVRIARRPQLRGSSMDLHLAGKTAVVTGSTAGIGLEIARRLAVEGADVIVSGRDAGKVDAAVASIRDSGGTSVRGVVADVTTAGRGRDPGRGRGHGGHPCQQSRHLREQGLRRHHRR